MAITPASVTIDVKTTAEHDALALKYYKFGYRAGFRDGYNAADVECNDGEAPE